MMMISGVAMQAVEVDAQRHQRTSLVVSTSGTGVVRAP